MLSGAIFDILAEIVMGMSLKLSCYGWGDAAAYMWLG